MHTAGEASRRERKFVRRLARRRLRGAAQRPIGGVDEVKPTATANVGADDVNRPGPLHQGFYAASRGKFFKPSENITQPQPLKISSMPTNTPITTSPEAGHCL